MQQSTDDDQLATPLLDAALTECGSATEQSSVEWLSFHVSDANLNNSTMETVSRMHSQSMTSSRIWKLSRDVLVLDPDGHHTMETIQSIIANSECLKLYSREPDTPCGSLTLEHDENNLAASSAYGPMDNIVSQCTLANFDKMKPTPSMCRPHQQESLSMIAYLSVSFDGKSFKHETNEVHDFYVLLEKLSTEVERICREEEPILLRLNAPTYVFGDIHGNYADLEFFLKQLIQFGNFNYTSHSLLFLGDYVDRGEWSIECVACLFAMKVRAPKSVFLLRGNHEDWKINGDIQSYGDTSFKQQCLCLFGDHDGNKAWTIINKVFKELPLAAIIDNNIFCSHGGIPRYEGGRDRRMELLKRLDFPRFHTLYTPTAEPAQRAVFRQIAFDLVWSDPSDDDKNLNDWGFGNNPRGEGTKTFGHQAVEQFLKANNFQYILRAHQEKQAGLRISKHSKVVTIFSTSGYCGRPNGAGVVFVSTTGHIRMVIKARDL
jgi:protein phosphatase